MAEKFIRSHRARVKQANDTIKNNPRYNRERINIIDREAFVEFYLLEDIVKLYGVRLREEQAYVPHGRADEKGKIANIQKFSAIIDVFNAAIGSARSAINSGDYSKVWKAIHEGALMAAASNVKNLPELRKLAIELLRELSSDMLEAVHESHLLDEDLDEIDAHEANYIEHYDIPPTLDEIEEVIRAAEAAIPDKKRSSRLA
ncbi:MAG: hypothetical protein ACI4QI_03855 [Candidatus Coproplasma sp.]